MEKRSFFNLMISQIKIDYPIDLLSIRTLFDYKIELKIILKTVHFASELGIQFESGYPLLVIPPLTVDNLSSDYSCRMVFLSVQFQQKSGEQFYNLNEQGMLGLRCLEVV